MRLKGRCFSIVLCLVLASCSGEPVSFCVLETTDLHGHFDGSVMKTATYIRQMQEKYDDRLLLLDAGDYLQGTPGVYYSNFIDTVGQHICARFFNFFPYTAIGVGNHDIEAGIDAFSRAYRQAGMPVVCANVVEKESGKPYFTPYIIINKRGLKIAILGLLTPYVSTWVAEHLRPGLVFLPVEKAAEEWMAVIKKNENPDIIIGLIHTGADGGMEGPLGFENAALWIARNVPGFHLICYGHDHRPHAGYVLNSRKDTVWLLNAGPHGQKVGTALITAQKGKTPKVSVFAFILDAEYFPADSLYSCEFTPVFERVREYENTPIAEIQNIMRSDSATKGPCNWLDEIHLGQLEMAGLGTDILPDVSIAAALSPNGVINKGQMYLKDFFTWFPYENSMCIIRMTGDEIVKYLEYSYENATSFINFDTAAGIIYTVHKERPAGDRIEVHRMADGAAFIPRRRYYVVMNSYRVLGGGGHLTQGMGWTREQIENRIVWESQLDMRRMFMDRERSRSPFTAVTLNHWQYK